MNDYIFITEEDIEAVILHENKDAFAAIINEDLYGVAGKAPNQNIYFHSDSCFDLFCIHVFELLVENKINTPDQEYSLSLFSGARWLAERHEKALDISQLIEAIDCLDAWLNEKPKFSFWCGDISKQIEFNLSRRKILRFAQLLSKHNLFRLTYVIKDLYDLCIKTGHDIKESEVLHLIAPFTEELKVNRIGYHSSYLVEMLHNYFTALNDLAFFFNVPTVKISDWKYLERMSSDTFKDFYYWAVKFAASYNRDAYNSLKPITTKYLKKRF